MKIAGNGRNHWTDRMWIMLILMLCIFTWQKNVVRGQRTSLDDIFQNLYRPMRLLGLNIVGRSSENKHNMELTRESGKVQKSYTRARSLPVFCDIENGPGRRSDVRPTSVHRLRPGDIDVVGALGDSLTAGNGIFATNILQVTVENRGYSWSIGGQGNWRKSLTLPNILKEFNPDLYGFSLRDSLATDRSSKFNVAELGAMSHDIPYESRVLTKRMRRDPRVNMTADWKMVTLLIGNNDFCSEMCYYRHPEKIIDRHEASMLETYRYLRNNVPRLIINVVPAPNLILLTRLVGMPLNCQTTLRFECPCLMGGSKPLKYFEKIMKKWVKRDYEIAAREEFNTDTFTINIQPFTQFKDMPHLSNGRTDFSFMSEDCFHLSQKGHAFSANALWNNLFEKPGNKTVGFSSVLFEKFHCPTEESPYILTRENIKPNFNI